MPTLDRGDDLVGVGGPSEGARIVVCLVEEAVDSGLEIDDRSEDAALQAPFGELGEEALDGVEPGRRGGRRSADGAGARLGPWDACAWRSCRG